MSGTTIPKTITALTARTQFGQIMRRAGQKQERFVVDRRGEPQVVIMGIRDFLRTIAPEPEVFADLRTKPKRRQSNISMASIDREIRAYRRERKLRDAATKRRT